MGDVEYRESDLKYIRAMVEHPDPVVTAPELAEKIDVTQQAAHSKLSDMLERGLVEKKQVGARAAVWWPTTDARRVYRQTESGS